MLEWDETEFIGILETIPEAVEDAAGGPFYVFNVSNNGIELELTVFPFEEDVRFKLSEKMKIPLCWNIELRGANLRGITLVQMIAATYHL